MASYRPCVSVYKADDPDKKDKKRLGMPRVLASPLRPDLVRYIHTNVSKNRRQAHGVTPKAGYDYAAESWCTGRAVARIPRVPGGGTHRAGQGAFGNMCRGGGMFAPLKTWRRWHRHVNKTQKRHAVASALAASSLPPLVMARGHRIGNVQELPLVVSNGAESLQKTKHAVELLKKLGCEEELTRILDSKKVRRGIGKVRVSRYSMRRGPLVVYNEDNGIVKAMRNIPGVETAHVERLNLLTLAPGGHFGRFVIWTVGAFEKLTSMYATKKGYHLPRAQMANADVARIINSDEVQSVVRPKLEAPKKHARKANALKNTKLMEKLNPGSTENRLRRKRASEKGTKEAELVQKEKKARLEASAAYNKKAKKGDETYYKKLMKAFETKADVKEEAEEEE